MWKKRVLSMVLVLFLLVLMAPLASAHTTSQIWGTANEGTGLIFNTPVALAKDSAGNVYVADMSNNRIVKIDQNGTVLKKFGSLGSGNGQFNTPFGVAIDNGGNILVADTANYRIQKFDSNWNFIRAWGTKGSNPGQFGLAREIGIDSQNRYHVVDEFNDRIQVFDENGTYLYTYGGRGTTNGKFRLPQGISIKKSAGGDRVYICDTFNNRVEVLDVNGNYITQLGDGTRGDSGTQFSYPRGVNVETNGDVYIADTYNHKIKKYNSSHVYQWSTDIGVVRLEPVFPNQVLPLGDGVHFIVTDTGNSQLIKYHGYSTYASVELHIGTDRKADKVFSESVGAAVDSAGNVYISDTFNHRIQKFDSNGNLLAKWGGNSGGGGPDAYGIYYWQFTTPKQVWYDKKFDDIYIADTGNNRIQVFSPDGTWLMNFGYYDLLLPMGVCTTSDGNIYAADTGHNRIVKYNALGYYMYSFGSEGMGDGQFRQPSYIAADSLDNIYVVDRVNNRVQKFDKYGNFITKWGTNGGVPKEDPLENWGEGDGDLFLPIGIAVDKDNNVWVSDSSNNRIQKFTNDGIFLEKIGIFSGTDGNFFSPWGIAFGNSGEMYVTDALLNRVTKFVP
ncbi:MAG: beta-propeller domain-containing protein [Desulfitobacteriaceae bacterium]